MLQKLFVLRLILAALISIAVLPHSVSAQAIWHCSRTQATQAAANDAEFKLSSFDAVGVTLGDLLDVYLGREVKLGQYALMACFMPGDDALSLDALQSLGLKFQVMQKLAAKSAIVQNHLHLVNDEEQMLACMERYYPAFGYFSKEVVTEKVVPCF